MVKKVLIATYPFSVSSPEPLLELQRWGFKVVNPAQEKQQKITGKELARWLEDVDAVIAGTERYDENVLKNAKRLKFISRVGIGLDSIDWQAARRRGIRVGYTPDAPAQAVAELTVGLMIQCARRTSLADRKIRQNDWQRFIGKDISGKTVGIVGVGRIGRRVIKLLQPWNVKVLANDLEPGLGVGKRYNVEWVRKQTLFKKSDIVSLHIPLTRYTKGLVGEKNLARMGADAILINTSRGGIVVESALVKHLRRHKEFFAALDVFEQEPYRGPLTKLDNVILTAHMGSCSENSRYLMEMGAVENLVAFFRGKRFTEAVP